MEKKWIGRLVVSLVLVILALAASATTFEKLGGEISFESVKDQGSEFFIRLPLRENLS